MGCDDEKLSKYLTHTFMAHCHTMICQQVTLSGEAEWPKVADAVIEADGFMALFGAPLAHEDHARRAVFAALALQRTLTEAHLGEPYGVECAFRMGLNSGL